MWDKLVSPPDNIRHYKFTDSPAQGVRPTKDINLEENKTTLFQPIIRENTQSNTFEQSPFNCGEAVSQSTSKQPSSLKSTTKVNSGKQEATYDLKVRPKNCQGRTQSKSMLENKQKSSVNLSNRNQSTWIIREENSRVSGSSKNNTGQKDLLRSVHNREDMQESFSQILANEVTHTEISRMDRGNSDTYFKEMMYTLREIRDISKESLVTNKKLVKLLEDRNQVSFLYDREEKEKHQINGPKSRKTQRKSLKKTQEKSTVKKMSKSIQLEERMVRVQEKLKAIYRKVEGEAVSKKTLLTRTNKKSTSMLR